MLVLTRKKEQEIVIGKPGSEAVFKVIEIRGDKVRLGVEADADVPVHRREVYDEIYPPAGSAPKKKAG